jgi:alpha-galactosidase
MSEFLLRQIKTLNIGCYRQDFNIHVSYWFDVENENNPDRVGIAEIKHVMGLYEMWDYLLDGAPGLIIDNCSSGGRRIDIESLKRSIPFFRSDYQCNFNENPEVLQTHNAGISCYLPYNGCTSKTKSDTYAIRSSYSSSWGGAFYNTVFQSMSDDDFVWAKKITDEYRSIRKYMSDDFYNHGSSVFDDTSWAIWQYHDEKTQSGILMAFRRSNSPFDRVSVNLKGLIERERYVARNLDLGSEEEFENTIDVVLPEKRSSVIFEYKIKQRNPT